MRARHQGTIEALREHASLLDLTHDTIFVRNHDDVITYWNRAATELYGWRPEQAIGRKAAELLQTEFPAPFDDIMAELNRTDAGKANWCIPRATAGASSWPAAGPCSATAAAVRAAILETNNDITERRQVEDGLHRAQSELAHVARVATLGELTASIAHEVNQPLAAVVTNGEACLRWLGRDGARPRPGAQLGRAHDQRTASAPARWCAGCAPCRARADPAMRRSPSTTS